MTSYKCFEGSKIETVGNVKSNLILVLMEAYSIKSAISALSPGIINSSPSCSAALSWGVSLSWITFLQLKGECSFFTESSSIDPRAW